MKQSGSILRNSRAVLALAAALLLGACATPLAFDPANVATKLAPWQAAEGPARSDWVIWGGAVIEVRNFEKQTEIEVLAYPLDRHQRPLPTAPSQGRFVVVLDGFAEPADFPSDALLTLKGHLFGTREGRIQQSVYRFPIVKDANIHVWTRAELEPRYRSNWSLGVGVGF